MNRLLQTDPLVTITLTLGIVLTQAAGYLFAQRLMMPLLSALVHPFVSI
ncbi:MAG: hypothetical protein GXP37_09475 [Chloroflexi bacterium]|nr:hypothetical protein [Chloroflexota bacterium]